MPAELPQGWLQVLQPLLCVMLAVAVLWQRAFLTLPPDDAQLSRRCVALMTRSSTLWASSARCRRPSLAASLLSSARPPRGHRLPA